MPFNVIFNLSWLIGIPAFHLFCGKKKYVIQSKNMGPHYISDLIFCCPLPSLPLLTTFKWLSVSLKIKAKALKLVYMSLQGMVPVTALISSLITHLLSHIGSFVVLWTCRACSHLRVFILLSLLSCCSLDIFIAHLFTFLWVFIKRSPSKWDLTCSPSKYPCSILST